MVSTRDEAFGYSSRSPGVPDPAMIVTELTPELHRDVLARLSIEPNAAADLSRLSQIYNAWSAAVPFDNVRKMIALHTNAPRLPGLDASDFFQAWLDHGTGATCWPGSIALHALLSREGFDVRRATGSMRDLGVENHGTLIVQLDGTSWVVDSSMLLHEPVALHDATYQRDDRFGTEVEVVDGTHVVWFKVPPHTTGFPCRLLRREVEHQLFVNRYNESRERSPFNTHLYARRNTAGGTVVIRGTTRFEMTNSGLVRETQLDRGGILDALATDIGISSVMIDAWVACGALDATMQPYTGPAPAPLVSVPPSRRR
jgi:arylamine N-acetyltransferase